MSQLRNSLMLYRPSFSCWTARKKDKDQSDKANKDAGAVDGAANVYKALLPDNPELLAVQKWITATRTWIYNTTLPWDDNGGRVARVEKHMTFMGDLGDRIRAGEELVEAFMGSYLRSIEEAKFKLNGMFNHLDYPSEMEVRRKFHFGIDCEAVPEAADFRIIDGLPQEEVDRLVRDAQEGVERRINGAMADAHERLIDVVLKMATTLEQYGNKEIKKFNDTLITNIQDLCAVMPALNLTGDKRLNDIAARAARLATYDLKDLRGMVETRNAAIAEARELVAFADNQPGFRGKLAEEPVLKAMDKVIEDGSVFPQHGYDVVAEHNKLAGVAAAEADPIGIDPTSLADGW